MKPEGADQAETMFAVKETPETPTTREVFDAVMALPSETRAEALDRLCKGETELRRRVERLLAAHAAASGFLADPTVGVEVQLGDREFSGTATAAEQSRGFGAGEADGVVGGAPGTSVGPYRLEKKIGEGGFGVVFRAEQTGPVRRSVAIKVIKWGMDTEQVVTRFEGERQALAMMDHPGIARVLDAGATESGRPYFVMELVAGEPVTMFCDAHRLSLRQRLELFIEVCQAVQHAHTKGIIHRDLKPSNVLVEMVDGRPAPKIIDFGIAKATGVRLTEQTVFTDLRQFIGTPQYMSPEQAGATVGSEGSEAGCAEPSGQQPPAHDIDTRSDIYGLGVLLYELLTGATPFDAQRLREAPLDEVVRIIRTEEPVAPSMRLGESATRKTQCAHVGGSELPGSTERTGAGGTAGARRSAPTARGGEVEDCTTTARAVRGDLDWIVLKCLDKDRTRRYQTAEALADDLRRYLNHQPVMAGPPTAGYRARKFVRRHRVGVAAGLAIASALMAGVTGTSAALAWALRERARAESSALIEAEQSRIARENEEAATMEAQRAQQERDKAERVAEFMEQILGSARPATSKGRDTALLKEMLDKAAERIEQGELCGAPAAELRLRHAIGETYISIAEFEPAERLLRGALAQAEAAHAGDHQEVALALSALGTLFTRRGDIRASAPFVERTYEMTRRLDPRDHLELAIATNNLGTQRWYEGKAAEAEPLFAEAIRMYRAALGRDHERIALALYNHAVQFQSLGRFVDAEPVFREALAMYDALDMAVHPEMAAALTALGFTLRQQGRREEAARLFEEGVRIQRIVYPGGHPDLMFTLTYLAEARQESLRLKEAETLMREALAIADRFLPGENQNRAFASIRLAVILRQRGECREALALVREVVPMARRTIPGGHPLLEKVLEGAGAVLFGCDDLAGAEAIVREAVGRRPDQAGAAGFARRVALGEVLLHTGRAAEAAALAQGELEAAHSALGDDHWATMALGRLIAEAELADGRAASARDRLERLLAHPPVAGEEARLELAKARSALGACLGMAGDYARAEGLLEQARTAMLGAPRAPLPCVRRVLDRSAAVYEAWDRADPSPDRAEMAARWRAEVERLESSAGVDQSDTCESARRAPHSERDSAMPPNGSVRQDPGR